MTTAVVRKPTSRDAASASEAVAIQKGLAPLPVEPAADGVDITEFLIDVVHNTGLHFDVAQSITSGSVTRTMAGASTLEVTVSDPDRVLMKSGLFDQHQTLDVVLDGIGWRCYEIDKEGDSFTLTFEERIVSYLRSHTTPMKISRNKVTRAEFIRILVRHVKVQNIRFISKELRKKQAITAAVKQPQRDINRDPGILGTTKDLTVKGKVATTEQLKNAQAILDAGVSMGANTKCLEASIMTAIQESTLIIVKHGDAAGPDSTGLFQQRDSWGPRADRNNATRSAKLFFKACIAEDKRNPNEELWQLCANVQHPAVMYVRLYNQWKAEAKAFVSEYGGGTGSGSVSTEYVKTYFFTVGPPAGQKDETYWDAMQRLATEVDWSCFVVGNTVYYMADRDLINSAARMEISEADEGIDWINGNYNKNLDQNELTVIGRADRWFAPPGSVVKVLDAGPYKGRWLVSEIERDLFSPAVTITARRPQKALKEPAHEVGTTESSDGSVVTGGQLTGGEVRDRIVAAAKRAAKLGTSKYRYAEVRPIPKTLFPTKGIVTTDCSGFATLCYKAARALDPNNFKYNGNGNTQSLMANGQKTNKPQPGDLVFYRSPEHVGVYIGDGKVIEFGGNPGPLEQPVHYRGDVIGYYTYVLGSGKDSQKPDPPFELTHQGGNPGRLGP